MPNHDQVAVQVDLNDGIAVLRLAMDGGVNKVNAALLTGLAAALDTLEGQEVVGIVLTSAHRDFCAGADLEMVMAAEEPAEILALCMQLHHLLDRLETGPPVVAALNGAALGGGYELALACHHRLAAPGILVGLPEVSLGVIPGGGGTQRLPRLVGLQGALEVILQGKVLRAEQADKTGLIDAVVPADELLSAAIAWIRGNPGAKQPWRERRFRWKGVRPGSTEARNLFLAASATAYKRSAGAYPAVVAALSVVVDGAAVVFERSLEIEARAFAGLATSPGAKAMIRTLFFHKTAAEKHRGLPSTDDSGVRRVAVLGAGMMGAGLAFIFAKAGFDVVLRDVDSEALARGIAHVASQVDRLKHRSSVERQAVRDRVVASTELEALRGVDLVIEAVPENQALKHRVIAEVVPLLAEDAIIASNTSALPIGDLAVATPSPERFIGLHFFSPVEKMELLEVVVGPATNERTIARCLNVAAAIRKLPIVVNDGYGFYTTRVFASYLLEGSQLVAEGVDPRLVDWAGRTAGMVVGPLQVFDEVTLTLGSHVLNEAERSGGGPPLAGAALVRRMVDVGRHGKVQGAGFYDYVEGKRRGIWCGLDTFIGVPRRTMSLEAVADRLMLAMVAEVGRTLDDNVVRQFRDAEIGAVFGIGFAPNTGGPLSWMDMRGLDRVVADLESLEAEHGERFAPSRTVRTMATEGARFFSP